MPLLLLWGARGHPPERAAEFIGIWKGYAQRIEAFEALPCGHYMQEEMPDRILEHYLKFFSN